MKHLLLITFILTVPFTMFFSNSPILLPEEPQEVVDLHGDLDETSERSMQITPIQATIGTSSLYITYANNLGIISTEVTNPSGSTQYYADVNTQTRSSLTINVSNWDNGSYQIRFEDSTGKYLQGSFEIK